MFVNLDKSILSYQCDWVVNLDNFIFIEKMIDYLTKYIVNHLIKSNLYLNFIFKIGLLFKILISK
jgi:hypothetical protein